MLRYRLHQILFMSKGRLETISQVFLLGALLTLPVVVKLMYDTGVLEWNEIPFTWYGLWIWTVFGGVFGFPFMKGAFPKLFLLSVFLSQAANVESIDTFFTPMVLGVWMFFLMVAAFERIRFPFEYVFVIGGLVNVGWAIAESQGFWWPFRLSEKSSSYVGLFNSSNALGAYLAISLPLLLLLMPKWTRPFVILYGVGLWIAASSMAVMGATIGLIFVAFKIYGRRLCLFILGSLTIIFLIFAFYIDHFNVSHKFRFTIWKASVELALQKPLFGHGLGSFQHKFNLARLDLWDGKRMWEHPHNEIINLFFEQGLFGVVVVGGFVVVLLSQLWATTQVAYSAVIVSTIVISMGFYPFHNVAIAALVAYSLGKMNVERGDTKRDG